MPVADRFDDGRAFLIGDAEHLMPPAGGFGMSVGIQSAHNLAWKLAAVLKGWAGPALITQKVAARRKDEAKPGKPEFFREELESVSSKVLARQI